MQFILHEEGRIAIGGIKTVFTDDATSNTNYTAKGTCTRSTVTQNGETYTKMTSSGTTAKSGAFPIGGTINVVAGERYKIRARGYRDKGTAASSSLAYLYIQASVGTELDWPGAALPISVSSAMTETWIEQIVTIPVGVTTLQAGVVWNTVLNGEALYIDDFEITNLTVNATPEYQYNLKDHLGNVRTTFTAVPHINTVTATFEAASQASEASNFLNYPGASQINNVSMNAHAGTSSEYLNGTTIGHGLVGLAKSYSVMPGDTLRIKAYAKFNTPTGTASGLANFASALLTAFNLPAPAGGESGTARAALNYFGGPLASARLWRASGEPFLGIVRDFKIICSA